MFAIVTIQALRVYTDLDDRTRWKMSTVQIWTFPKTGLVWLRHFNLNVCRGENTANCQQQAWCEPNMASMKNKGSPDVVRPTAAMCSAHGTLVTFCVLPHVTDFNGVTRIQTLTLAFPVCRNSVDILDIFQLRGEKVYSVSLTSSPIHQLPAVRSLGRHLACNYLVRKSSPRPSALAPDIGAVWAGASGEPAVDYSVQPPDLSWIVWGNLGWRWHRDRVN